MKNHKRQEHKNTCKFWALQTNYLITNTQDKTRQPETNWNEKLGLSNRLAKVRGKPMSVAWNWIVTRSSGDIKMMAVYDSHFAVEMLYFRWQYKAFEIETWRGNLTKITCQNRVWTLMWWQSSFECLTGSCIKWGTLRCVTTCVSAWLSPISNNGLHSN